MKTTDPTNPFAISLGCEEIAVRQPTEAMLKGKPISQVYPVRDGGSAAGTKHKTTLTAWFKDLFSGVRSGLSEPYAAQHGC